MVAGLLVSATCIGLVAAQLWLRFSEKSFQLYGMATGLTAFAAIAAMFWRLAIWESTIPNFFGWFLGVLQALTMTVVVLHLIAWKRVFGTSGGTR